MTLAIYNNQETTFPTTEVRKDPLSRKLRTFTNPDLFHPRGPGVYLTTNELCTQQVAKRLLKSPSIPHACHIGFSSWYNLDIMALRKPEYGIVCDYNVESTSFMEKTLIILLKSKTRQDFASQITAFIQAGGKDSVYIAAFKKTLYTSGMRFVRNFSVVVSDTYKQCKTVAEEVQIELTRPGSWLSNDESFQYIQEMATKDKIACITEDICASEIFQKIRALLNANSIQIDSLYLSNIPDYFYESEQCRTAFKATVQALTESETHVIIANCHLHKSPWLEQHFLEGTTLKKEGTDLDSIFWIPPSEKPQQIPIY